MGTEIPSYLTEEDLLNIPIDHLRDDREMFRMEIANLRSYIEAVEKLIVEQTKKIENESQKSTAGMNDDERQAFYERCGDELNQLDTFPRILRYSIFVHSYSCLEKWFEIIANDYGETHNCAPFKDSSKSSKLKPIAKYLKKFPSVQFPNKEGAAWKDINIITLIRNCVVHNDGRLSKIDSLNEKRKQELERIQEFIEREKWKDFISSDYRQLEFFPGFLLEVLNTWLFQYVISANMHADFRMIPHESASH